MALGKDPMDTQVYMDRLTSRPNTAKEYCILHVSYLDEEMTVFLGKKQQQGNFRAYIQRTYPKPTAIIDKFKEKLNFFYQEWATLFQVIPQKAVGKPMNAYV